MSAEHKAPQLPPYERLSAIYGAICAAAMTSPWAREPYAVIRREERSGGVSNNIPNYKAYRLARWLDDQMDDLAFQTAERMGLTFKLSFQPIGYKRLTDVYEFVRSGKQLRWLEGEMRYLAGQAEEYSDDIYQED